MILENGVKLKRNALAKMSDEIFAFFHILGICAFFLAIWEFAAHFTSPIILPSAVNVLKRAFWLLQNEQSVLWLSLQRCLSATILAFFCGVILGVVAANFKSFALFVKPIIDILQGIAPIIWVVIALFWFGIGGLSVGFSCFITILPLSFAASLVSVLSLNKDLKELCKAYKFGILKRLKIFYLPSILPFLLTNLSLVFAMGVKITLMAELLGASDGVGVRIADGRNLLDSELILGFVVLAVGLILAFENIIIKSLKALILRSGS